MTRFRQALLDELQSRVTAEPAPVTAKRHLTRPRLAFGGGLVAVAAATATVLATSGGAGPAYAVTTEKDGTLAVAVNHAADPSEVNRTLAIAGEDKVKILRPSAPEDCPVEDRGTPADSPPAAVAVKVQGVTLKGKEIDVRPAGIPDGIVVVVVVHALAGSDAPLIRLAVFQAPGPRCVLEPAR